MTENSPQQEQQQQHQFIAVIDGIESNKDDMFFGIRGGGRCSCHLPWSWRKLTVKVFKQRLEVDQLFTESVGVGKKIAYVVAATMTPTLTKDGDLDDDDIIDNVLFEDECVYIEWVDPNVKPQQQPVVTFSNVEHRLAFYERQQQQQDSEATFTSYMSDAFTVDDKLILWWFHWLLGTKFMARRHVDITDRKRYIERNSREDYADRQLYKTTLLLVNDMLSVKKENSDAIGVKITRMMKVKGFADSLKKNVRTRVGAVEMFCDNVPSRNKVQDLKARVKRIVSKVVEQQRSMVKKVSGQRRQRDS